MDTQTKVETKSGLAVGVAIGVLAVALIAGASWAILGGAMKTTTTQTVKKTTYPKTLTVGQKMRVVSKNNIQGFPTLPGVVGDIVTYGGGYDCPQPPCALMGSVSGPDLMSCSCPGASTGGGPVIYSEYWTVNLADI